MCYLALGEHSCCTSLTDGSVRFSVQRTVSVSDILGGTVRLRNTRVCVRHGRARGCRATVTLTAVSVFGVWRTLDAYKMMPRQTQTTGRAQASAQPRSEHRRARARPAHPASPIRDCSRTVLWHKATRRADGRRHTPHAPSVAPACGVCTLKQPAQACADQHAPHRSRSQGIETCSEQSLHSSPRRPRGLPRPRRPPLCR